MGDAVNWSGKFYCCKSKVGDKLCYLSVVLNPIIILELIAARVVHAGGRSAPKRGRWVVANLLILKGLLS